MPNSPIFWISVVMTCAILYTEASKSSGAKKDINTALANMNGNSLSRLKRGNSVEEFLDSYTMSDNMRSFLGSNPKRMRVYKRSTDPEANLKQLELVIRSLAANLKRQLSTVRSEEKKVNKKMVGRNANPKSINQGRRNPSKKINKKDLIAILKKIARENGEKPSQSAPNDEINSIKKEISEIKRSLVDVDLNSNDVTESQPVVFNLGQDTAGQQNSLLSEEVSAVTMRAPLTNLYDVIEARIARAKMDADHDTIEKIYEDVEELKKMKGGGGGGGYKDGFPCEIQGTWTSQMGGRVLNVGEGSNHVLSINTTDAIPPKEGFLNTPTWKLCGTNPFPKQGIILVTGINESCKQVAAFIGECKNCGGREIVEGQWLVGKLAKGCEDIIASQDVIGDVWKKEVLHELRKKKLSLS